MNRRSFLRRVAAGTVGTIAVAVIPASAFNTPARKAAAHDACCRRLLALYNAYTQSRSGPSTGPVPPPYEEIQFRVGPEFFQGYKSELVAHARFISANPKWKHVPHLLFRGVRVVPHPCEQPWDAHVELL